ncbi:glycyl-tRNA synthetase [Spraguea lophii 42_110]|uniref:glycine--tRNA ligase n=1 Tax=Spraguea lophii (strain 42_110) TaxID=1358809 RepID=S7W8X7_SPRLO|nr:glycyl-tRNA synthetase [Spraguea lophii 42_110]
MNKTERRETMLRKRFFIASSFSIYGGVSGLYDLGPLGTSLKNQILRVFRDIFCKDLFEIESTILTPYQVLKASGHIDKFCDILLFDSVNGECYRADHYLKEELEKLDKNEEIDKMIEKLECMSLEEIDKVVEDYKILSKEKNNLSKAQRFNLMFETFVGPKKKNLIFLRPETAQGQFVNFKKVYELNSEKLPFGTFSIGKAFRNEISPKNGLLRVREFEQAEIEYFLDEDKKEHKGYDSVKETELTFLYGKEKQVEEKMKISVALERKIIDNSALAFFIGKAAEFFTRIGIKNFRMRQHMQDEMAHYACDCWDVEVFTSYGWIECAGIADRSTYDVKKHIEHSKNDLYAREQLKEPIEIEEFVPVIEKNILGKKLKNKLKDFIAEIELLSQDYIKNNLKDDHLLFNFEGEEYKVKFILEKKKKYVREIIPNVIEPSFGIGRILYSLIEEVFECRDEEKNVLNLNPEVAPYQLAILSVINNMPPEIKDIIENLEKDLSFVRISNIMLKGTIGKKYSIADEIGIPFCITVDEESISDKQITIRERNSTQQIRVEIEGIEKTMKDLIDGKWNEYKNYLV